MKVNKTHYFALNLKVEIVLNNPLKQKLQWMSNI